LDFLNISGKCFLISGVANKKSIATQVTRDLLENGAKVFLSVQSEQHKEKAQKLFPDCPVLIVDVQNQRDLAGLTDYFKKQEVQLDGFLHSIAFANYAEGIKPFHETSWEDFALATQVSCHSLMAISNSLKNIFKNEAAIVTISISNTKATSYGHMGPVKALLESSVGYLAKSFSAFSEVRFNAVCAGPLKTSASAGIPGYIDNYLFAEKLILRKKALKTQEVANTVLFLLSPRSSGVNGTGVLVDGGMILNTFDEEVVQKTQS
jgi:enoyl-[acyl-carrier protein] reductase I